MKKLSILLIFISFKIIAQPGPALMQPSGFIKDANDRTVTMKNGEMTNKPITSYWQLHGSGFQPMTSVGTGGYMFRELVDGGAPNGGDLGLWVYTLNPGNIPSAGLIAPLDLPHNSEITAFEACYWDRSGQAANYSNCDLKFTFYRIVDNSCPPEVLGSITSQPSGNSDVNCPIRCTSLTLAPVANLIVNNKDYFYYVTAISTDSGGGGQQCGNWLSANLGIRGVQIEFKQK
jgi:hypothetical protein